METIEIKSIETAQCESILAEHGPAIFGDAPSFRPRDHFAKEANARINELGRAFEGRVRINLAAYDGGELMGWSWGIQESAGVFYVVNSAVRPAYRRRGVYTALSAEMVKRATALGFQVIYSRHVATNNAVLIPKLKAGFIISSFEISDQFGVLVHLRWYANATQRKMMEYRAGGRGYDAQIASLLK